MNFVEDDGEQFADVGDLRRAMLNILEDFTEEKERLQELQSASLNILEDFAEERKRLARVQRATLNILEDFTAEKHRLEELRRAALNILEDFGDEKNRLAGVQRATLNILDDFTEEKQRLEELRRASLNILEDFGDERNRLAGVQRATLNILEDFGTEKEQMHQVQRATLNLLEDFDAEKTKVARTNRQLEASNQELDSFCYTVSHDLRAPVRGTNGFSRILLEKYASNMEGDGLHCLHMIRDNSLRMGQLIDDLLAFSRLSQSPLVKEPVRQEALVQAALATLEAERKGRQIDLAVGELTAAKADPRLLKQVWVNLIANALKYTRGRDKAVIRIGSETKNGVPVYFVQDNGVGFDMRYAHKLFGVFQRLHRAEDYEGTGVGLAIVQRIIGRHGGRIWAQAVKNEGATFYFTLQEAGDHAEQ